MSLVSEALARDLRARFEAAGAVPVEADVLQSADMLLELYGEDIRTRAYVTQDPARGELMLRPDFTVPVALRHLQDGAEPARYTYAGPVFRRQEDDPARASEYQQAGYELFDTGDSVTADAEVFALIADALRDHSVRAVIGDMGILAAAVTGLGVSEPRQVALMRHLRRPRRFRALLDRYSGARPVSDDRRALLAAADPLAGAAPAIGLRGLDEVETRLADLRADAAEPPMPRAALAAMDAVLGVAGPAPEALARLRAHAEGMPALTPALDRFEVRLAALEGRGIAPASLDFEASFGRTSMEYYDGFVFGFLSQARPDLPPLATGGRYDALTARLADLVGCAPIPAVGAVIRPDLLIANGQGAGA